MSDSRSEIKEEHMQRAQEARDVFDPMLIEAELCRVEDSQRHSSEQVTVNKTDEVAVGNGTTNNQDINNILAEIGSGSKEEQAAFMKELDDFYKEQHMDFKPILFGKQLNCLKLWRAVIKLGGYKQVTSCELWQQIGESFRPPMICLTVAWTFKGFYERTLLEYEKHKMRLGELPFTDSADPSSIGNQASLNPASGPGRARRNPAAWVRRRESAADKAARTKQALEARRSLLLKYPKPQRKTIVTDNGPTADWVKVYVQRAKDCYEIYALVPGLLPEEVSIKSTRAGLMAITCQPEPVDNHRGVTPFNKIVTFPSKINSHQTSAVVTSHGQLFVRVPFEQADT